MPVRHFLQQENLKYLQIGTGKNILLAFHGFGQGPQVFQALQDTLPNHTIFSFDLLSFGKETSKHEVIILLRKFIQEQRITRFSVLGFSIGAKVALCVIENFSDNIEKAIFVAPDGFQRHFWHDFATSTTAGKIFFKTFVKYPKVFNKTIFFFYKIFSLLGMDFKVDMRQIKIFTHSNSKRWLLWETWFSQKKFAPKLNKLRQIIQQKNIAVKIFIAYQDKLCPEKPIRKFACGLSCVEIIPTLYRHELILQNILKDSNFVKFIEQENP